MSEKARQMLASFCTEQSLIRSTLISDTFRASNIVVNGTMMDVDIERYKIPFTKAREAILRERYGMTDDDIKNYYSLCALRLRNGINIVNRLHKDEEFEASAGQSLVSYVLQKPCRTPEGDLEVYLFSRPMMRFLDSDSCKDNKMTLLTLVNLGIRFAIMLHKLNEVGVHIGAIDMDTLCMAKSAPGAKKTEYVTFTSLFYASSDQDKIALAYPKVMPFTAHPALAEGGVPTDETDLYSLAAVLATIANQTYGTDNPSLELKTGVYPDTFVEAIRAGINGTTDQKGFNKMLRDVKKSILKTEYATLEIPLHNTTVSYLDGEQEDEEPVAEEPEAPAAEDEGKESVPIDTGESKEEEPELLDMEFDIEPDTLDKAYILPGDVLE